MLNWGVIKAQLCLPATLLDPSVYHQQKMNTWLSKLHKGRGSMHEAHGSITS